jgi:hypothetical protein
MSKIAIFSTANHANHAKTAPVRVFRGFPLTSIS